MTNISTALADVLEADRKLAYAERWGWPSEIRHAKATLEAMSEELIAAWDEHINATIRRAVASMPDATAVPTQDYET